MGEARLGRFGDRRLAATGDDLLVAMQRQRTMCLAALAEGRAETRRFNGFLDNEAVSLHEMLTHAGRLTAARAAGRQVLAIADTTELNFATHGGRKRGFGAVGNGRDLGVLLHPVIAVEASGGGVLGLVWAQVINRQAGKAGDHKRRGADEKESRRWLAGAEMAGEVLAEAAGITVLEDREGDIYDQFARLPAHVHLLTRAAQDRALVDGGRLFDRSAGWPEAARVAIEVPAKRGGSGRGPLPARRAEVAVRFGSVQVRRPARGEHSLPAELGLRVVHVSEVDPPTDPGQRIQWCLLTTHAVGSAADALRMVQWYRMRWTIEQVFRALKGDGVDVETSQITTPGSLLKLALVGLIAAIRVMQLVIGRDGSTGQPLSDAFTEPAQQAGLQAIKTRLEGATDKLKNPFDPASLAWLAWIAARLGGWSGYTSRGYKPAGPKIMGRGLKRLDAILEGWTLRSSHSAHPGLP